MSLHSVCYLLRDVNPIIVDLLFSVCVFLNIILQLIC
jgi:hypothetical protein